MVERTFAKLTTAFSGAVTGEGTFPEQLDAVTTGYLAFLEAEPHFAPLIIRELTDGRGPGRELIVGQLVPLLDGLESLLAKAGRGAVRPGLPWRAALLQLGASPLLRAASGPLREPVWGPGESLPALARMLILA